MVEGATVSVTPVIQLTPGQLQSLSQSATGLPLNVNHGWSICGCPGLAGYPPHPHLLTADASSYAASYHPNPFGLHHHPYSGYGYGGAACLPRTGLRELVGGIPSCPGGSPPPPQEPCPMRLLRGQCVSRITSMTSSTTV